MISRVRRWHRDLRLFVAHMAGLPIHRFYNLFPGVEFGLTPAEVTRIACHWTPLAGRRAVHVTDLHLDRYLPRHHAAVEQIAALNPDWIFVTGDFLNVADGLPHLEKFLVELRALAPVYLTLGNHDHYSEIPVWRFADMADRNKLTLLVNQVAIQTVGPGDLCIVGLDDPTLHRADPSCIPPRPPDRFTLVLAHAPVVLDLLTEEHQTDLVLCGHTHGGQWHLPGIPPFWLPYGCQGRASGFFSRNGHHLYVNRGLGWSGLPFRYNCPPEILLIEWVVNRRLATESVRALPVHDYARSDPSLLSSRG